MFKKLYFLRFKLEFVDWTLSDALEDTCKEKNIQFELIDYGPGECHLNIQDSTDEPVLIFFIYDGKRSQNDYNALFKNFSRPVTVQYSADTHYFLNDNFWLADYYIDTMSECVAQISTKKPGRVALFNWTLSQKLINQIESLYVPREKDVDFICMCRESANFRRQFFGQVRQHFSLLSNLNEYSLEKIVDYYARSKYTLGTTSSCMEGENRRSMKGMRDFIGPLCEAPLLCDDFPQIKEYWPVHTYRYGDIQDLISLYNYYETNDREEILTAQKEWLKMNTCDIQLSRIIDSIEERENV